MVDDSVWPVAVSNKPCNAVSQVSGPVDVKIDAPFRMYAPSNIAGADRSRETDFSGNDSSIVVVRQKFIGSLGAQGRFHALNSNTEAARADEIRAGLEACYTVIDAVK